MQIEFERTGGFGGLRLAITVDTETLAPEAANELARLIAAAGFYELPAQLATSLARADQFQYRLSVSDGARSHTITADEGAPETVQALFRKLIALARTRRA